MTISIDESDAALPYRRVIPRWKRRGTRRVLLGFMAILGVMAYGVAGYVALGWSAFDALYQVVITISGVGFGEVRPMTTAVARIHTMAVIAFGITAVGFTAAAFVQFLTESELISYFGQQRMLKQIESMSGHTIVAGYGRMGAMVCDELRAAGERFVVIEQSHERIQEMEDRGCLYVTGDATEEKVLMEAGIARARVLISSMPNDAENVFITLTGRQVCPALMIVSRAEQLSTVRKLTHAGANHVVMPAAIGAQRIVSLVTKPAAVQFAELVTQGNGLAFEMEELPVSSVNGLSGRTLREADIKRRTGVIVVAVRRGDGQVDFPASSENVFMPGDVAILLGSRENLSRFRENLSEPS
jgi:voltage-gated potassium channel